MQVSKLWRYPTKSRGGEPLETAQLTADGITGDRIVNVRGARSPLTGQTRQSLLTVPARLNGNCTTSPSAEPTPEPASPCSSPTSTSASSTPPPARSSAVSPSTPPAATTAPANPPAHHPETATTQILTQVRDVRDVLRHHNAEREGFRSAVRRVENSLVDALRGVQPGVTAGVTPAGSACTRRAARDGRLDMAWSDEAEVAVIGAYVSEVGGASPRSRGGSGPTSRDA